MDNHRLSREGVWNGSRSRTAVPNASESLRRLLGPGPACSSTRRPISDRGREVLRTEAAGYCFTLPQEISLGPFSGRRVEGNNGWSTPREKSDRPIVAPKPGNAG